MIEKLTAISLYTLRYSDKNSIAHLLTREQGRIALLIPQGNTAAARYRNALFMPLAQLQVVAATTPGSDIMRLREVSAIELSHSTHSHPIKNALAIFMAESLSKVVIGKEDSVRLFDFASFIAMSLESQQRGLGNFHICFMLHLAILLGIYPDTGGYMPGYGFDLVEARFIPYDRLRPTILNPTQSHALWRLCSMSFDNMHRFRYNRSQRLEILDGIIQYYKIHGALSASLKTPNVLSDLFG